MTYDQIKNLRIDEVIAQTDWLKLAKECVGIVETSTMKDKEIYMLIESAIEDLERVDVDVQNNTDSNLIKDTVMIYVKAHFGDTDINKRKEYLKWYKSKMRELMNTDKYKKKEDESNA